MEHTNENLLHVLLMVYSNEYNYYYEDLSTVLHVLVTVRAFAARFPQTRVKHELQKDEYYLHYQINKLVF